MRPLGVPAAIFACAFCSFVVDRLLELLGERLGAVDEDTVHEERRCALYARGFAVIEVLLDLVRPFVAVEPRLVGDGVFDARFLRPLHVAVGAELPLILERGVVPLPECVVPREGEGALRGFRGGLRILVEGQRVVLPDHPDLVGSVRIFDLLQRWLDARAIGALEVAVDDDGHGCFALAPHGVLARNRNGRLAVVPRACAHCPCPPESSPVRGDDAGRRLHMIDDTGEKAEDETDDRDTCVDAGSAR